MSADGATLAEVIDSLEAPPGIEGRILDEQGAIRRFVNVYVGRRVRFLESLDTAPPRARRSRSSRRSPAAARGDGGGRVLTAGLARLTAWHRPATADRVGKDELDEFVRPRHKGTLVTRRRDGSPQMSPVTCGLDREGRIVVSTYRSGRRRSTPAATPGCRW